MEWQGQRVRGHSTCLVHYSLASPTRAKFMWDTQRQCGSPQTNSLDWGGGGEKERNLETLEEKAAPCKEENAWRGGRPAGAVVPAAAACTA